MLAPAAGPADPAPDPAPAAIDSPVPDAPLCMFFLNSILITKDKSKYVQKLTCN